MKFKLLHSQSLVEFNVFGRRVYGSNMWYNMFIQEARSVNQVYHVYSLYIPTINKDNIASLKNIHLYIL